MKNKAEIGRKNGVDCFKLIAAFFVMILHADDARLDPLYAENARLLGRWAVPFFFMASGFFLGRKIEDGKLHFSRIQKNIAVLISISIIAGTVFLIAGFFKESYYYKIENFLTGTHYHLWFIGSLLFGYLFIWYIYFIKQHKILPYLSIVLLILALIADAYDLFLAESYHFAFFRFLLAIPFLYVGMYFSKKEFSKKYKGLWLTLVFLGVALQLLEAEMFYSLFEYSKYAHQFLVGTILITIPLFLLSASSKMKENVFSRWGRDHSFFLYLYHPLFYMFLMPDIENKWPFIQVFSPFICFVLSLFLALILSRFFPRIYLILTGKVKY